MTEDEVVQVSPRKVLGVCGVVTVERHRDVHFLGRGPQGVVVPVIDGTAVDEVRRQHQRDGAEITHGEASLRHSQVDVLKRHQAGRLESLRALRAEVGDPAIPRAAHRRRQGRFEAIDVDRVGRPRPEQDADVDALDVHGLQHVLRWRAATHALPAGGPQAQRPGALSLRPVDIRREDLAIHLRAHLPLGVRHRCDPATELWIEVVVPQVPWLDHVEIAVHDAHPLLGHLRLQSRLRHCSIARGQRGRKTTLGAVILHG